MKADEQAIKELVDSPKAHQLLNHLSILGVKETTIDIKVNLEKSWLFLGVNAPFDPPYAPAQELICQSTMQFVEGQIAFVHNTYIKEDLQGKGIYGLFSDLRDRMIEKLEVKFQSSMIRNDNTNMQKAALKHGWKKSFVGTNHSVFVKEVYNQ